MNKRILAGIAGISLAIAGATSPAHATITTFLSAGTTCDGVAVDSIGKTGQSVFVSVCATTTTEWLCGNTLKLSPSNLADTKKFVIKSRTVGPLFTEVTSPDLVFPVVIPQDDMSWTDFGATSLVPIKPGPKLLLATFEIGAAAAVQKAAHALQMDNRSMLSVSTNGRCDETGAEIPLRATFSISVN